MMNQLTRCGLLPSAAESLPRINLEKEIPIHLGDNIIVPAPFAFRPFAQFYNPYSRGCSVLCNHPVDEETKQQASLHHAKNITDKRYRIVIDDETENENWQSDIFVPEALFRRYTETDSRPPSPTATSAISNLAPKALAVQSRRCVTPDPTIHVPEKPQLILDLRKTASQTALDTSSQHLSESDLISSWKIDSKNKEDIVHTKNNKSNVKSFVSEKLKTGKQMPAPKKATEITVNNKKQSTNDTNTSPIVKALQEDKKKKKQVKRLKSKKKDSKRCSSGATKNGVKNNLQDPNETQISTLDEESGMPSADVIPDPIHQTSIDNGAGEDNTELDPYSNPTSYLEEHMIKRLRKEFNCGTLNNGLDKKYSKIFEKIMSKFADVVSSFAQQPDSQSDVEYEIRKLQREFRLNSVIQATDSVLNVAGIFSKRNARFELPLDRMSLEGMTHFQYLKTYVHIIPPRMWVYNRVFEKYTNGEEFISIQKLCSALVEIMGRKFSDEEESLFNRLFINTNDVPQINFETWCGVCAFCERIFSEEHTSADDVEDDRYEVEIADFESLDRKIQNLKIREELREILYRIRIKLYT